MVITITTFSLLFGEFLRHRSVELKFHSKYTKTTKKVSTNIGLKELNSKMIFKWNDNGKYTEMTWKAIGIANVKSVPP